jgi:Fungal chitosanase of glycosyl hydrolase group 75
MASGLTLARFGHLKGKLMPDELKKTAVVIFGTNYVMQLDNKPGVLFWSCPLAVDADGHPEAYHPEGSPPGLDFLANAGKPGNWWGISCDSRGKPFIQTDDHPSPGFYISTTALEDHTIQSSDPARYVHSGKVPFIVLPSRPRFDRQQQLGDLCMCFCPQTGNQSWAIYADIGPANKLGEGSMYLSSELGLSDSPKSGGTSKEIIVMVYWPGSKIGWPRPHEELRNKAYQLFADWGGLDTLALAMPQFDWSTFTGC